MLKMDPARGEERSNLRSSPLDLSKTPEARTGAGRTVLVAEDKDSLRALFARIVRSIDCTVLTAASLPEALAIMRNAEPDIILLDLRLLDSNEQNTLDAIFAHRRRSQVIVVSGFLTTELVVRAMQLGAHQVLDKPVSESGLVRAVLKAVESAPSAAPVPTPNREQGAAAHLVDLVLRALNADRDLKKLDTWATHVGLSVTMLRQACYLAHLPPHDVRDFVRALVGVIRSRRLACELDLLLDNADTRTRDAFLERSGLTGRTLNATVKDFLAQQQFIPAGHEVLRLLRQALM